jgi:hypothetical protein
MMSDLDAIMFMRQRGLNGPQDVMECIAELEAKNKRLVNFMGSLSPIRINDRHVLPVSEARWNVFVQEALKEKDDE